MNIMKRNVLPPAACAIVRNRAGWQAVNLGVIPLLVSIWPATAWLSDRRRRPAAAHQTD